MSVLKKRLKSFLEWLQPRLATILTMGFAIGWLADVGLNFWVHEADLASWDWLFLSGLGLFIVGFRLSLGVPREFSATVSRLRDGGAYVGTDASIGIYLDKLTCLASRWGLYAAIAVALVLLVGTNQALGGGNYLQKIFLLTAEIPAGAVAGYVLGRMSVYGLVGLLPKTYQMPLRVQPGHPDGCAGFKPIGDFYLQQGGLAALPAGFLAAWLILIPLGPFPRYDHWRLVYAALLGVAIAFEVLAFIVPIWGFHRVMERQKAVLIHEADELGRKIARIKAQLAGFGSDPAEESGSDRVAALIDYYQAIEDLPTWPVSRSMLGYFSLRNLALLVPFVVQATEADKNFPTVIPPLEKFLEALSKTVSG
jgi:hypothetical protein